MSYLGNSPTEQAFVATVDYFNGDGSTVAFTLSRQVTSVAQVQAVIENVPQNPSSAFTVLGNVITFTSAPPVGTANIYVYYTSPNTKVIAPSSGTVGMDALAAGAVTTNKVADAAITQAKLAAGVAGNGPAFSAYSNANQSVANATNTKIAFQVEEFDTNGNFDSTTNYRFTPTVAGYYKVALSLGINSDANIRTLMTQIYKNGSQHKLGWTVTPASAGTYIVACNAVVYFNGSTDYVEGYAYQNTGSSQNVVTSSTYTYFQASLVRAA